MRLEKIVLQCQRNWNRMHIFVKDSFIVRKRKQTHTHNSNWSEEKKANRSRHSIDKIPTIRRTDDWLLRGTTMRMNWKLSTWVHASHPIETSGAISSMCVSCIFRLTMFYYYMTFSTGEMRQYVKKSSVTHMWGTNKAKLIRQTFEVFSANPIRLLYIHSFFPQFMVFRRSLMLISLHFFPYTKGNKYHLLDASGIYFEIERRN